MAYQSQEQTLQSLEQVIASLQMVAEELKNKIPPTGITHATGSIPVTLAPDGATNTKLAALYDFLNNAQLQVGIKNFPSNFAINNLSGIATDSSLEKIRLLLAGSIKIIPDTTLPISATSLPLPKGTNTPENCISVTLSPTGALVKSFGLTTDAPSNSDTETTSFLSFFKYFLKRFSLFVDGIEVNGSANSVNGIAIASTDVHVYSTAVLQVTTSGVFIGSFVIQGSNDANTWYNLVFEDLTSTQTSATRLTSANSSGLYNIPRLAKFIRVVLASLTTGSITARMIAKK